jgi:hypothetical protein
LAADSRARSMHGRADFTPGARITMRRYWSTSRMPGGLRHARSRCSYPKSIHRGGCTRGSGC